MAVIGVVADDFTGTASSGMLMAKAQVETGLFFDAQKVEEFNGTDQLQAVYVSSNSRCLPPDSAYAEVEKAVKVLEKIGVQYFSKKIDTTLRGGIGYEIDAMLDNLGEETVAVMVTAMPQSKRVCVGGYSVIDGVILTETSVAQDVKTPVSECYVPDLIGCQSKRPVKFLSIREVKKGQAGLMESLKKSREQGGKILIVDAITMEHVRTIAEACTALGWKILAVDPGPFTMQLACSRGIAQRGELQTEEKSMPEDNRTALIIAGSANPSTKTQMEILYKSDRENVCVSVSPHKLIAGGSQMQAEVAEVVGRIKDLLDQVKRPKSVIVETALHGSVVDLKEEDKKYGYLPGTSSAMINEGLALITDQILEEYGRTAIVGLMLTGGDTMECVCRKIGVSCIKAIDNIVAQVDVGRILGKYEGMPVIVKGGFCGYDEIGVDIVKRLHVEGMR
ncbi:four-carbon acid sugar kinase family protein [Roseburia hominis]